MNGTIFNIQKFSVNDGPGIRTTVFLKGCPLRCIWCHNPESKSAKQEIFFDPKKCLNCGKCMTVCPNGGHKFDTGTHQYDRTNCDACGKCTEMCMPEALETVGKDATVQEVIADVLKDKPFYDNSGGGMTISGGEPMLQFDFTLELLKAAKAEGLHTAMETCGFAKEEQYKAVAEYTDLFLYDYKLTNPEEHKKYTGVSNELILSNLKMLNSIGSKIILRCPIIPTINDNEEHFDGIIRTANSLSNVMEINIEPYHPLGKGKSEMLDKEYKLDELTFPEDSTVKEWIDYIASKTNIPVKKP